MPVLLVLAVAVTVAAAIALTSGDEEQQPLSGAADPSQETRDNAASGVGGQDTEGVVGAEETRLDIGGQGVPAGAQLGEFAGERVTVGGAAVAQVDGRSGFFIGDAAGQRTFVAPGDGAGPLPQVGDRVDVSGRIAAAPEQPGQELGISGAGANVVSEQGGYIEATEVAPAG